VSMRSCPTVPCDMTRRLRYVLLISCLWMLVLKLEFISSYHYFSLYIYRSATNNLLVPNFATVIVPSTCLK
jgi:hypothetical protein